MPNRRPREGWRFGLPWVRMKRAALASVALVVVGVALVFVSPGAGIAFACLGFVGLFLAVFIGVLTAAADQPNPTRKNFGGRYTDFGFLFGVLDGSRRESPTRAASDDCSLERDEATQTRRHRR